MNKPSQTADSGLLSRNECNALRGLAILGIFLHNYCHWLSPAVKENEYQFFRANVDGLQHTLCSPDALFPVQLLSFFGHYGVPVFLFLSAYGLTMKYERAHRTIDSPQRKDANAWAFVRYHFLKLFRMMIVGFVAFTMLDAITPGQHHYQAVDIVAQLGMFNNLLPSPDRIIWPGPYWFFGLMLQLYIVYRLLLFRRHWGFTVGLMLLCTAVQLGCGPESEALNRWRYNFVGGMLPFGAGLLYSRYAMGLLLWRDRVGHTRFDTLNLLLSTLLIVVFSFHYVTWYLVPLCVCSAFIALVRLIGETRWLTFAGKVLVWMGTISAALFVCHPITRKIFIPISRRGDIYAGLLLYIIASLCLAWLFVLLMRKAPKPTLQTGKDE